MGHIKQRIYQKTCKNVRVSITVFCNYAKKRQIAMDKPEALTVPQKASVMKKTILQSKNIKLLFSVDWVKRQNHVKKCHEIYIYGDLFY